MNKNILELPEDLKERRNILETELRKVVTEQCFSGLKTDIEKLFKEFKIDGKPVRLSWEYYGEYDDEGGTDWCPRYVSLEGESGEIEMEEIIVNKKSKYSEDYYDYNLNDEIYDLLHNYKEDLYENDIEEIVWC